MNRNLFHAFVKQVTTGIFAACVLGNTYAAATKPTEEKTVELSPFVVDTSADKGYSSKNTISGTGFNLR